MNVIQISLCISLFVFALHFQTSQNMLAVSTLGKKKSK